MMSFGEFCKRSLLVMVILLLVVGIWVARGTLLLGFASAVIAIGISIPASWLRRQKMPRGWAIACATFSVLLGIILLMVLILPQLLSGLIDLLKNIPTALRALSTLYENLRASNAFLKAALQPLSFVEAGVEITPDRARELLDQLVSASLAIAPSLLGGVSAVATVLINLVFVLFIAIFFLVDPKTYVKGLLFLTPKPYHQRVVEIWNEVYRTIRLWISALSLSIIITAALVWIILGLLLGMPNALVVAVFAGIATFIPNVGVFLPLIPITVFTLASDPTQLAVYIPVYLLIQLLESNVITPSIVKAELEIPAGGLMLFQLLAALALGPLGLLLAVPMLAVIIVLVREIYAYDLLGLRQTNVVLQAHVDGSLSLTEVQTAPADAEVPQPQPLLPKPVLNKAAPLPKARRSK